MIIDARKASEVAELTRGRIVGDPTHTVTRIDKIDSRAKGALCFLANPKYERYIYESEDMIVLVDQDFVPKKDLSNTLIYVDDVYGSFAKVLNKYADTSNLDDTGIDPLSAVDENASLHETVKVGKFAVINSGVRIDKGTQIADQVFIGKNVRIGENTVINPGAKIYHDCIIGSNVIIHANVVVGCDGFGFSKGETSFDKIPQVGNVIIEDDVEIGSGTTIDRASIGSTVIKRGVKLDNLIMIGHNVIIGENTVIAAQSGIAGSTIIGKGSQLGGQVGIAGHIRIAPGSMIQAKSGVASSIEEENQKWYGYPILAYTKYLKSYAIFKALPSMLKRISAIEKKVKNLKD